MAGVTLVELMVALAIGSFLIIGAVQIATQSRQAFRVNESIARVQETAQFALDTLEADLRMASNWGMLSRPDAIEGRWLPTDDDPLDLLPMGMPCGAAWALDLATPIEGSNNAYTLTCGANGGAQAQSDTLTVRRAAQELPTVLEDGRLYVQSTRTQARLFADATIPPGYDTPTAASESHALIVNTYYVAADSELIPGVPALRRKTLTQDGGDPDVVDLEVVPGVENLQVQFGVDVNGDNAVDQYVNPDNTAVLDSPASRVLTARIWLVVRSVDPEFGIEDDRTYAPGDVNLGTPADAFRRIQVSKTILLRNART
jgi:type IV pilus assembly protein PilW